MASKTLSTTALLLTLNILFFTMVSSASTPCPPPPKKHVPKHHPKKPCCTTPSPKPPTTPSPKPPTTPSPKPPTTPSPTPTIPSPTPTTPSPTTLTCPRDTLKLGVCGNLLNGLLNIVIGTPSKTECCSLISGLVDLDAAVCLCTALKANILGINLNLPISLSLLLNVCGKRLPSGYQCA